MYDFTQPGPLAQPPEPKKSILDSVLERLYPSGAFAGLLPPETLHDERMMALRHSGLSLMASAGPRSGYDEPRSFGADLATALDPTGWQQQIGNTAQTALAIHGAQRKLQDEQLTDAILARYPRNPNATPQEDEQRLRAVAGEFQAHGLWEPAQVAAGMIEKVRPAKIETDILGPDKTPDGSTQLVNKQTGETIKTWARGEKPVFTPEQKAQLTLSYSREYENQIGPVNGQVQAYKAYHAAGPGRINDPIRLANALKIIVPSGAISAEQVLNGQASAEYGALPIIGELLKAFGTKGELDPKARTMLDAYVEAQAPNFRANAQAILRRHRERAEAVGLDPNQTTYDPLAGETSLIPVPSNIKRRAARVRKAAGQ